MDKQQALKTMKEVKKAFNNHKVEIWLNYGTLLGAVRDKGFIEWDDDVDMSSWYKDIDKIESIGRELVNKGYDVVLTNDTLRLKKDDIDIDVYLYQLFSECNLATKTNSRIESKLGRMLHYLILEGILTRYSTPKKGAKQRIIRRINKLMPRWLYKTAYYLLLKSGDKYYRKAVPANYITELSNIKFYDTDFDIPCNTKNYLTWLYGPTWNKPIDKWHQKFIDELEDSLKSYPRLHVQCPKCNLNQSVDTYKGIYKQRRTIKLKCNECNYEWEDSVFIAWTINNLKYNPFKVYA